LIAEFGYEQVPKAVVGFSQGGYLAPFLAQHLSNVITVVGIGTGYRTDYFAPLSSGVSTTPSVHAIHGSDDSIFPLAAAEAAHQNIIALGFRGTFHSVEKGTHVANEMIGKHLSDLLFQEQARLS
jgi:predicted esterase